MKQVRNLKKGKKMKVNQDTEFEKDTIVGSGGVLYALANKTESTDEDGKVSYIANAIKIDSIEDADKAIRNFLLDNIKATTQSGNVFDGDDSSMLNMSVAIQSASVLGKTNTMWKLADNSVAEVNIDELKEALALSIQAKGAIILG